MFFYTLNGNAVSSSGAVTNVTIEEIAVQLGRIPRWCGATNRWLSVLHHSLFCARVAEERGHRLDGILSALAHDFHEAFTGDIPMPFMTTQTEWLQGVLDHKIMQILGIPYAGYEKIKSVDDAVRVAEAYEFCAPEMYQNCEAYWGSYDGRVLAAIRDEYERTGDTTSGPGSHGVERFLNRYKSLILQL